MVDLDGVELERLIVVGEGHFAPQIALEVEPRERSGHLSEVVRPQLLRKERLEPRDEAQIGLPSILVPYHQWFKRL